MPGPASLLSSATGSESAKEPEAEGRCIRIRPRNGVARQGPLGMDWCGRAPDAHRLLRDTRRSVESAPSGALRRRLEIRLVLAKPNREFSSLPVRHPGDSSRDCSSPRTSISRIARDSGGCWWFRDSNREPEVARIGACLATFRRSSLCAILALRVGASEDPERAAMQVRVLVWSDWDGTSVSAAAA
jgi:hypothetical protein